MKKLLLFSFALFSASFSQQNLVAQESEDCAIFGYEVAVSAVPTMCEGSKTGEATISSDGCVCMFSGCNYLWDDGQTFHTATNLEAGIHTVTVTHPADSLGRQCIVTMEVEVPEGDSMIDDVVVTPPTCDNGSNGTVELLASPFAGVLEYTWTNGSEGATAENLAAGTYAVQVVNFANCVQEFIFDIETTASFTLKSISTSPACSGLSNGMVAFEFENAVGEVAIIVVDDDDNEMGTENLGSGDYEVFFTDENGCTTEAEFTIEEGDLTTQILSSSPMACTGQSVVLSLENAQTDWSYNWMAAEGIDDPTMATQTVLPAETSIYEVEVTAGNGCQTMASLTVEVADAPPMNLTYNGNLTICANSAEFVYAFASVSGATGYAWQPTEGVSNPNTNIVNLSPSETTAYTVTAFLSNGCEISKTLDVTVEDCNATTAVTGFDGIQNRLFPNPSNGIFNIQLSDNVASFRVLNVAGQIVQQQHLAGSRQFTVDLGEQTNGIYFLQIETEKGTQLFDKLMKQ